ncbi:MAG TPA: hypothetical protein V6C57_26900 [Coleofasciculaceae cyanobacterium]
MATQEKSAPSSEPTQAAGKLDLAEKPKANGHTEAGLALRTESPGTAGAIEMAGTRPIASSHLEIYAMILNNRPISASHQHIVNYSLPGHRPVFASELAIREDLTLPGGRPVMVSDPHLMASSGLPGGRPIASNDTVEGETLMGFLD